MITNVLHRESDRRLRWVARHPDRVNSGDIRRLLARELPADQVEIVSAKAQAAGIAPFTMWMWIRRFEVRTLALAVAADVTHAELLAHLGTGVAPDVETLQVFAAINGLQDVAESPAERAARVAAAAARTRAEAARRARAVQRITRMPEITEPGGWPFDGSPSLSEEQPATPDEGSCAA